MGICKSEYGEGTESDLTEMRNAWQEIFGEIGDSPSVSSYKAYKWVLEDGTRVWLYGAYFDLYGWGNDIVYLKPVNQ